MESKSGSKNDDSSLLRLSIGGKSYLVSKSTAFRNNQSILAALASGNPKNLPPSARTSIYILKETGEYFVERSPLLFDLVLQYARTGRVQCPSNVCEHALKDELAFWRLRDEEGERRRRQIKSALAAEATGEADDPQEGAKVGCLAKLWRLFEYPRSSKLAMVRKKYVPLGPSFAAKVPVFAGDKWSMRLLHPDIHRKFCGIN